ncbi:uracil-DNA glycosylase domain protein [Burkholderia thailandensis]|uniref:Uracil-DNA glycosylase domain protein n=1 Tax=Burkholderia thailandensis TaxID=57975 RepID=A0AAW9CWM0_BURTH|nr:uracil-DNA glycosylase domain protein [Burkholderia thailandensis]
MGAHAQAKRALSIRASTACSKRRIPSPLSAHRGFLGAVISRSANDYLVNTGRAPIDWRLPDAAETLA